MPRVPARGGADRRCERRFQVELPGQVRLGAASHAVTVSDLSASGALVSLATPSDWTGATRIVLVVEEFGEIDAEIVHVGDGFWGLRFDSPHLHRDKLSRWLQEEVRA